MTEILQRWQEQWKRDSQQHAEREGGREREENEGMQGF